MSNGTETPQQPGRWVLGKLGLLVVAPVITAVLVTGGACALRGGPDDLIPSLIISLSAGLCAGLVGLTVAVRANRSITAAMAGLSADAEAGWQAALESSYGRDALAGAVERGIAAPARGITQMAETLAASDSRGRRAAQAMARSGTSLLAMIGDTVVASAGKPAAPELETGAVDAAELAEDVCALFWGQARAKGLDLAAYVDPATP
ncbi:MAG TPA: hypothetical protein VFE03_15030, partial [Caulobacteraceae bacterium]|nr:hypothetical protein [Caulobacteraceae bacterium]